MSQHADVLVWGHGPEIFEVFLEPTCPFSVRAFNKFDALLAHAGEENITLKSVCNHSRGTSLRADSALYPCRRLRK